MRDDLRTQIITRKQVKKYSAGMVFQNWLLSILILLMIITTLPIYRDTVFHVIGIIGGTLIKTPSSFVRWHINIGLVLLLVASVRIIIQTVKKQNNIVTKRPLKDFKGYVHSFFYLIGFARRMEQGGGDRYYGWQKMVYLALVYSVGLLGISGLVLLSMESEGVLRDVFLLTHVLSAGLFFIVLMFHIGINVRRHDLTELKCFFVTGRLPLWHVKKHHKIWYAELKEEMNRKDRKGKLKRIPQSSDPLADAIIKLVALDNFILKVDIAKKIAEKFRQNHNPMEIKRIIHISKEL